MELEVERLWAKKLQARVGLGLAWRRKSYLRCPEVFAPIPFNRNGAIVGILRIAFKAGSQVVRLVLSQ